MSHVLATGAYLKNSAGLWQGGRWQASALHGDLGTPEACAALEASAATLLAAADGPINALAHDLHPDFFSTRLALALAQRLGVPAIAVQHHVAHIGVALAEQAMARRPVQGPVIGIALDGLGLGSDGSLWGGELLRVQGAAWSRVGHLQPLALPGGDRAALEPWRLAAAALHALGRGDQIGARFAPRVGAPSAQGVMMLLQRGLFCPMTSSAGRWFDAAAAALGLCDGPQQEAQAAIALQALAGRCSDPVSSLPLPLNDGVIDLRPLLDLLFEVADSAPTPQRQAWAARLFHQSLADALAQAALQAAQCAGTNTVALGGGCFFNPLLSQRLIGQLQAAGLQVLRPATVSCGDAGLALGQAWMAAQQLALATPNEEKTCA